MKKVCEEKRVEIKIPLKESKLIEDFFIACDEPIHALNSKLLLVDILTWLTSLSSFFVSLWIVTELIEILANHSLVVEKLDYIKNVLEDNRYLLEEFSFILLAIVMLLAYIVVDRLANLSHFVFHKIHKLAAESIIKDYGNGVIRLVLSSKKPTSGIDDIEACLLRSDLVKILNEQKEFLEKEGVFVSNILREIN